MVLEESMAYKYQLKGSAIQDIDNIVNYISYTLCKFLNEYGVLAYANVVDEYVDIIIRISDCIWHAVCKERS